MIERLTFGTFRGYTARELMDSKPGRNHARWLLKQKWFRKEYPGLEDEIDTLLTVREMKASLGLPY